ncbi:hypothetical protein DFH08DRAFT_1088346 [Mycena albidolilacea]|uniref:Uncharacterized protein n=1 Tax=Mycena albidolilacea TaxID=1033008 RepID=A0AAD6Z648_9AGAR|nr:hypothetical protein DFH08DRAFT_1088346 [Mycena albidolilacea]
MDHHVRSHNSKECQIFCEGCPRTFSRTSVTWTPRNAPHTAPPARRGFLAAFEQRPDVVRTREECDYGDKKTVVVFNKNLIDLFDKLVVAFCKV